MWQKKTVESGVEMIVLEFGERNSATPAYKLFKYSYKPPRGTTVKTIRFNPDNKFLNFCSKL